jgi:hypothetical protein
LWTHGRDALQLGRPRPAPLVDQHLLVGPDLQLTGHRGQQFARAQQKLRAPGPPEALVAFGEGLIEQDAAGGHRGDQSRKEGPVEVVGAHHRRELPSEEGKRASVLQIRLDHLEAGMAGEIG